MYTRRFYKQSGIAIGPILFVVAILAILAAAIAAGSGSYTAGTTTEGDKTRAAAILAQVDLFKSAVQRVIIENSCNTAIGTEQLSFSNPSATALNGGTDPYVNANAPANNSCNIFDPNGGGIIFGNPPSQTTLSAGHPTWVFSGCNTIAGIGPLNEPITAALLGLSNSQCSAINLLLTGSSTIPSIASPGNHYNPVFYPSADAGGCSYLATLPSNICVYDPVSALNVFYSVLLAR